MKILLIGEYSHLHNSLKKALLQLGHEVVLLGTGDGFKNYPVDVDISSQKWHHFWQKYFYLSINKLVGYNQFKKDCFNQLMSFIPRLKDFDLVQLINVDPFMLPPDDMMLFYKELFQQNIPVFLSACGEDSHIIQYYGAGGMRYSILDPYKDNSIHKEEALFSYRFLDNKNVALYHFVIDNVKAIIPSDLDYAIPYSDVSKAVPMIPNPVDVDSIAFKPLIINDKICIFFGINRHSFYKKGGDIVLKVLDRIEKAFGEKVQIALAENLAYDTYMKRFDDTHIFIDQLYSYDQGYNALEAMAKGKCVLTGAEKEFEERYNLSKQVAVNVLPDESDLYHKLVKLIENPEKIIEIGKNARFFVEKHHNYTEVAKQYLDVWQKKA